jgi:hypothetical protein
VDADELKREDLVAAARERVHARLQALWEKAGKSSSYVKSEWLELEEAIDVLSDVSARAAAEWMRAATSETLEGLPELFRDLAEISRVVGLNAEAEAAEGRADQAAALLEEVEARFGRVDTNP